MKEGPKAFKISKDTLISCALLGLVCQALYNYVYSSAINSLGVSFACVMTYMAPAFASVISYFSFREKFGPNKYLAMILNLAGCVLTVTGGSLKGMSFATYNFLFGTIFLGLFGHPWTTVADPMNLKILAYGFVYALIPTGICYIIYFNGVSKIKESSKVPVVASVENVVAVIVGVMVFHEKVGLCIGSGINCGDEYGASDFWKKHAEARICDVAGACSCTIIIIEILFAGCLRIRHCLDRRGIV